MSIASFHHLGKNHPPGGRASNGAVLGVLKTLRRAQVSLPGDMHLGIEGKLLQVPPSGSPLSALYQEFSIICDNLGGLAQRM